MEQKQQIADRIKQANNILVTVSSDPSIDQLASAIALTLVLNKMSKHATALFSGTPPSTIEFLQPEKTFEADIDSLRDFIISLDKTKADKLRYKVEDSVVKIFITPYRTSLSDKDLQFSQGEFNVDVVIAIGVHNQSELDQAITSHGRILHDATVATINTKPGGELGSINWLDPAGSSLSELVFQLIAVLDKQQMDAQIATALLTGIVAETDRFRNERTTPSTMSSSAELMAAGANQQLVMTKLEEPVAPPPPPLPVVMPEAGVDLSGPLVEESKPSENPEASATDDGTLEINHAETPEASEEPEEAKPSEPSEEDRPVATLEDLAGPETEQPKEEDSTPKIHIDDQGGLHSLVEGAGDASTDPTQHVGGSRMILQPPSMGGAIGSAGSSNGSFSDPLAPFQSGASSDERPSGEPAALVPPAPTGFAAPQPSLAPPSLAPSLTPPVLTPPSEVPTLPLLGSSGDVTDSLADLTAPAPAGTQHVDNARDAVSQALSFDSHGTPQAVIPAHPSQPLTSPLSSPTMAPPDLSAPASAPQPSAPGIPVPAGSPPPVPPPMMPQ